jgi:hypothetical protein
MSWDGNNRRVVDDDNNNQLRRAADQVKLSRTLGKIEEKMNTFDSKFDDFKHVLKAELDKSRQITDSNFKVIDTEYKRLESLLLEHVNDIREDQKVYENNFRQTTGIYIRKNNDEHQDLEKSLNTIYNSLNRKNIKFENKIENDILPRIDALEAVEGDKAKKKLNTIIDTTWKIVSAILLAIVLGLLATNGIPIG